MSSMLSQAIIDAEELKNTAERTAKEQVVEKYQVEIKEAVDKILEGFDSMSLMVDEPVVAGSESDAEIAEELPLAHNEEDEYVEIDLDQLEEMLASEEEDVRPEDLMDRETVAEELDALAETEAEIDEEDIHQMIAEILGEEKKCDCDNGCEKCKIEEATPIPTPDKEDAEDEEDEEDLEEACKDKNLDESKDLGRCEADLMNRCKSAAVKKCKCCSLNLCDKHLHSDKKNQTKKLKEIKDNNNALLHEQKGLLKENKLLKKKVEKFETIIFKLNKKLEESNLMNSKLHYTNRVLDSVSVNGRQKKNIVEAIKNANSVEEAKLIFDTLQSAVGAKSKKRGAESLNEVISANSSAFIPPRKEEKPKFNPFQERMKRLAGIN